MSQNYDFDDENDINIDIDLEIAGDTVAEYLEGSEEFLDAIALRVRNAMIKKSRAMGNLYGRTAQRTKPRDVPTRRVF